MKIYQSELLKFNLTEKLLGKDNNTCLCNPPKWWGSRDIYIPAMANLWLRLLWDVTFSTLLLLMFWGRVLGTDVGKVTWMLAATYKRADNRANSIYYSVTGLVLCFISVSTSIEFQMKNGPISNNCIRQYFRYFCTVLLPLVPLILLLHFSPLSYFLYLYCYFIYLCFLISLLERDSV